MEDRLSRLESRVQTLEHSVQSLEQRLARVEREKRIAAAVEPLSASDLSAAPGAAAPYAAARRDDFITVLSFIGRTFVALGGAYLLRALTDSHVLPAGTGLALGLAYGLFWLVPADRAGSAGARLNAAFHALVFALIAYPLLWEATVRFKFVGPDATALGLGLVTLAGLFVAVRRRLHAVAWIVTLAALPAAIGLIAATAVVVPFAWFLLALGITTLWLGYSLDWVFIRWPVALVADVAVLALILRIASGSWGESAERVVLVQLALLSGYVASIAVRTLVRDRDVNVFEVLQAFAALGVGFGGAVYVAHATGSGVVALALINLVFGIACYAVAFVFIATRQGLRRNFYFYTSLALILVLVSTGLLLAGDRLALGWALLGVLATIAARWLGRVALNLHAAVYVIAAGAASGLLASATFALIGPVTIAWGEFTATSVLVLLAAIACWLVPMSPGADWGEYSRLPRLLLAMALVWSLGGWLVGITAPPLGGLPGAGADPGIFATVRTTVLAGAALGLAWMGRHERFRESAWLLYPVLVAGGIKLLLEDLPQSRPSTLFVALALYGGALIAAPRLTSRRTA